MFVETIAGSLEVILGYFIIVPLIVKLVPGLQSGYNELSTKNKNLFRRKFISICHGLYITCWYIKLHYVEDKEECEAGWLHAHKLWAGFLLTDAILSEMNGTANFDDRTHHVLYGTIHAFVIYFNSGCTLFNALSYRYYADFFNQNQQLRLILAMFNQRKTNLYIVNYFVLVVGFFLVRVAIIPFAWYQLFTKKEILLAIGGTGLSAYALFGFIIVVCILSDMQNIDWFKRMFAGLQRTLKGDSKTK